MTDPEGPAAPPESAAATQLRKGVLEYCVLALLQDGPRYGVELLEELGRFPMLATSQGTIYPLLSRLRRSGLAETFLRDSASGPSRRYYTLTEAGRTALAEFATLWPAFRTAVDHLLTPGATAAPGGTP
ncbi:PadR family transcriptional regulator [Kitasatospora sp. MMS16-BH015]|uniref:PadR family transcriptional regulator n=1 Tax=Kitasatospora sp. MMS16-BH015 TaxID=2018025 RepID=UPI000CA1C7A4|nr:PadR family transcriptional regulator [Kitasatospora sp. MMS16-BH015]AUG75814.1 PadR family transcriptional regulator [Kitasatospora sp. MMS16-BH015]